MSRSRATTAASAAGQVTATATGQVVAVSAASVAGQAAPTAEQIPTTPTTVAVVEQIPAPTAGQVPTAAPSVSGRVTAAPTAAAPQQNPTQAPAAPAPASEQNLTPVVGQGAAEQIAVLVDSKHAHRSARRNRRSALFSRILVRFGAALTVLVLLFIVCYILVMGLPHISLDLFALPYTPYNVSLMPALINTVIMTLLALCIAVPLGIGAAIYLIEYTGRGNRLVGAVRLTAETLTGIPSIVYGLFGLLFFVTALGWRISLLSGAFTLAIMILPIIMRTTEEALKAVPDSYREGSFGLGSGRLRTVFRILLPSAMPGILAGVILGIGRIVGESAALIYTAGTVADLPGSVFDSTRTLSVHMYVLASEGLHIDKTYATAVILLAMVLLINTLSAIAARQLTKGKTDE